LALDLSKLLKAEFGAVTNLEEGNVLKVGQQETKESPVGSEWKNRRTVKHLRKMDKIKKKVIKI